MKESMNVQKAYNVPRVSKTVVVCENPVACRSCTLAHAVDCCVHRMQTQVKMNMAQLYSSQPECYPQSSTTP